MNCEDKTRNEIISKILSCTPSNIKPIDYIMELLNISRASAFRRLKGIIPFTYDEVVVLAKEMNFSLDELIHAGSRRKHIFEFEDCFNDSVQNIVFNALNEYYNHLCTNQKMKRVMTIEVLNNLWFIYTLFSDNLFKFYYYIYFQQYHIPSSKMKMKDMTIPYKIIEINNKIKDVIINTHNWVTTSIIDRHIFLNTLIEIQYYYRRGFLEKKELELIANDIITLLNNIEKGAIQDIYEGRQYQYYITQRNIYSNSVLVENDNQVYSFFYHQNVHPVTCYDKRLCDLHKNYLLSHKRQSILISSSNEELQMSFFEKQHEYVGYMLENRELSI